MTAEAASRQGTAKRPSHAAAVAASLPRFAQIDEPAFAVHAHLVAQSVARARGVGTGHGKASAHGLLVFSESAPTLKLRRAAVR